MDFALVVAVAGVLALGFTVVVVVCASVLCECVCVSVCEGVHTSVYELASDYMHVTITV